MNQLINISKRNVQNTFSGENDGYEMFMMVSSVVK